LTEINRVVTDVGALQAHEDVALPGEGVVLVAGHAVLAAHNHLR
jgi:hypothetical protein